MKIQIKNLGAIKEATIDLDKKLTVFCGPNGTGKTYMSYALYALTKFDKIVKAKTELGLIETLFEKNSITIAMNMDSMWELREKALKMVTDNLWNAFAVSEMKSKEFFKNTEINISETKEEFVKKITKVIINEKTDIYGYSLIFDKPVDTNKVTVLMEDVNLNISEGELLSDKNFFFAMQVTILSRIQYLLEFYPLTGAFFFPIERNAIYTFSKELSIMKLSQLEQMQGIANPKEIEAFNNVYKSSTRYPQAIRDNLKIAQDLDYIQQRNSEYYDYAKEIEDELLNGKVTISDEGNVEFRTYRSPKMGLAFNQSASIVKTLASLIIYLKHSAEKNDLIIIDEPELNLHPNSQIILTRIFARLINKGLRFVISTHSDYIIRELNNLIMVGADNKDVKDVSKELGYKEDEFIKFTDVGAYLFDYETPKSKQVKVKPIKIDKNGFEVSTFDKTIEALNKCSDELFYTLKYGKAKE